MYNLGGFGGYKLIARSATGITRMFPQGVSIITGSMPASSQPYYYRNPLTGRAENVIINNHVGGKKDDSFDIQRVQVFNLRYLVFFQCMLGQAKKSKTIIEQNIYIYIVWADIFLFV